MGSFGEEIKVMCLVKELTTHLKLRTLNLNAIFTGPVVLLKQGVRVVNRRHPLVLEPFAGHHVIILSAQLTLKECKIIRYSSAIKSFAGCFQT